MITLRHAGPFPFRRPARAVPPPEPPEPVYDWLPLTEATRDLDAVRAPHGPDALVFGPPGTAQGGGLHAACRWCGPCGVGWVDEGPAACWSCGRAT